MNDFTDKILQRAQELKHGNIVMILAVFLLLFWALYDFVLVRPEVFRPVAEYTLGDKTPAQIKRSLEPEGRLMVSGKTETEKILAFVHVLERYHYLLYKQEINLQNYYDSIEPLLYPEQKNKLIARNVFTQQVRRYLRRLRQTEYDYLKYEVAEPVFYYEDYTRNAEVSLVRTTRGGSELLTYYFRLYKDGYYLYIK